MRVRSVGRLIPVLAITLWVAVPATGRQLDTLLVLPSVTISAGRVSIAMDRAPARVTLLDSLSLSASARRSLADVLELRTPATVRRYGSSGLASISLRGTTASQTLVLLDGQPIGNPQLGQADLSLIPLVLLEAVEVRQGSASSDFGSGALGGVVHLRSVRAEGEGVRGRVRAHAGAFGRRDISGMLTASTRGASFVVAVDGDKEEGAFSFVDGTSAGRAAKRRVGADRAGHSVFGSLSAERDGAGARISAWSGRAERGLPGPSFRAPAGERQWDRDFRMWGTAWKSAGRGQVRAGVMAQRLSTRYLHPAYGIDETGDVDGLSADMDVRQAIGRRNVVHGGLAAAWARVRHPSIIDRAREQSGSAFVGLTSEVGRALVYPAVRIDRFASLGRAPVFPVSPSIGANVAIGRQTRIKAQVGRSFRMPTLNDRFWVLSGNPELRPEVGWSGEVGIARHVLTGEIELTAFRSALADRIVWLPAGEGDLWRPVNVDFADVAGLEAGGRVRVRVGDAGHLDAGGSYVWTDTWHDGASGRVGIRYVPRHQARAFGDFWWRRLFAGLSVQASGSRFLTEDRSEAVRGYAVVDTRLGGAVVVGKTVASVRLLCENVLDASYAIVRGYPMPPRHIGLQLELSF